MSEIEPEEIEIRTRKPVSTSWKTGQSGNPNGRPKHGSSITETFQQMMKEDPRKRRRLVKRIYKEAIKGNINAAKLLWSYMDGLPVARHQLESKEVLISLDGKGELHKVGELPAKTTGSVGKAVRPQV